MRRYLSCSEAFNGKSYVSRHGNCGNDISVAATDKKRAADHYLRQKNAIFAKPRVLSAVFRRNGILLSCGPQTVVSTLCL
jgi:hypothetical protein